MQGARSGVRTSACTGEELRVRPVDDMLIDRMAAARLITEIGIGGTGFCLGAITWGATNWFVLLGTAMAALFFAGSAAERSYVNMWERRLDERIRH